MAGSLNEANIIGNLGADPEVRHSQAGDKIVTFTVATSESWRDKNTNERRENTEWHRVVIFGNGLAEVADKYLRKGSKVYISGKLQTRKWAEQSGVDHYTTEIVLKPFNGKLLMLDNRRAGDGATGGNAGGYEGGAGHDLDDEVPF